MIALALLRQYTRTGRAWVWACIQYVNHDTYVSTPLTSSIFVADDWVRRFLIVLLHDYCLYCLSVLHVCFPPCNDYFSSSPHLSLSIVSSWVWFPESASERDETFAVNGSRTCHIHAYLLKFCIQEASHCHEPTRYANYDTTTTSVENKLLTARLALRQGYSSHSVA